MHACTGLPAGAKRRIWEAEASRHVRENGLRPVLMPVPRVHAKNLPLRRFREEFALPRLPGEEPLMSWVPHDSDCFKTFSPLPSVQTALLYAVVIEGLANVGNTTSSIEQPGVLASAMRWDLSYWRQVCGKQTVRPVQFNRTARTWGGYTRTSSRNQDSLEEEDTEQVVTMADFISSLELGKAGDQGQQYLADFGLPRGCPPVETNKKPASIWRNDWKVPVYFERDFFQNASELVSSRTIEQWAQEGRASPRASWPSLFIGNAGTRTGLHVDYGSSHFWMLTIEGQKDW